MVLGLVLASYFWEGEDTPVAYAADGTAAAQDKEPSCACDSVCVRGLRDTERQLLLLCVAVGKGGSVLFNFGEVAGSDL